MWGRMSLRKSTGDWVSPSKRDLRKPPAPAPPSLFLLVVFKSFYSLQSQPIIGEQSGHPQSLWDTTQQTTQSKEAPAKPHLAPLSPDTCKEAGTPEDGEERAASVFPPRLTRKFSAKVLLFIKANHPSPQLKPQPGKQIYPPQKCTLPVHQAKEVGQVSRDLLKGLAPWRSLWGEASSGLWCPSWLVCPMGLSGVTPV